MTDTISELLLLHQLLLSLGISYTAPIPIHSDNKLAISLAANPFFHARTKYFGQDFHSIRDEILRGTIAIKNVSTKSQLANILTKTLVRKEFEVFLGKVGVCNLLTPP